MTTDEAFAAVATSGYCGSAIPALTAYRVSSEADKALVDSLNVLTTSTRATLYANVYALENPPTTTTHA